MTTRNDYENSASKRHLDAVCDFKGTLTWVCDDLERLAFAFSRIGMHSAAEEIHQSVKLLKDEYEKVYKSHGELVSASVRSAEACTKTIMDAVFTGCIVGAKDVEKSETTVEGSDSDVPS